jgi:hypothetical protein
MTLSRIAAKVLESKNIIAGALVVGGLLASAWGFQRVPSEVSAVQQAITEHTKQTDVTNHKLDVLICLQAKLDIPIRCVAKEKIN